MITKFGKCLISFSDGSETYNPGDENILVLPSISTSTHWAVGTDYCGVVMIEKKYISVN